MRGPGLAGLLLGDLGVGAQTAGRSLQIPSQLGAVVQGTLLLVIVAALALFRWQTRRTEEPPPDEGEPPAHEVDAHPSERSPA